MKVSWIFKGKMKYGTILEIKGKGALVQDEKGKEKIRLLNTLNPVQEKEDDKKKMIKMRIKLNISVILKIISGYQHLIKVNHLIMKD